MSQSVLGDRLGHVLDVTREDPHARAYRNRNELDPHTDRAHVVGLFSLRAARKGGVSHLTSALAVHNRLLAGRPDCLERLYEGFYMHRRGEEAPGEDPVTPWKVPVYSSIEGKVSCRWVRTYAVMGQEAKGEPLDGFAEEAVEAFLAAARSDECNCGSRSGRARSSGSTISPICTPARPSRTGRSRSGAAICSGSG